MTVVVGTAGHIDHGKTTLLRALTGIDADRLPEERRRGMTIDVGYAHLALPDGSELDFVDVPGHDRLVGNMLVGAGEVDAALLVVAADDGIRPQTEEHLALLDALAIRHGIVTVTKADLVEPERAHEVAEAVAGRVARTSLAGSPVLTVSAATGDGLPELRTGLERLRDAVVASPASASRRGVDPPPTLAVDRVFSVKGRGVVVTGTLRGGPLGPGDVLRAMPAGTDVRVREVQVHGRPVDRVAGGGRTALNVTGPGVEGLARGHVLTADSRIVASDRLLVGLSTAVPDRARFRCHVGTNAVEAAVGRAGRDDLTFPSGTTAGTLRLGAPVAVRQGDRFVLRRASAPGVVGGVVLDPIPARGVSRRRQTPERVAALASAVERGDPVAVAAAVTELHGIGRDGAVALAPDVREAGATAACETVAAHHRGDRTEPGAPLELVRAATARAVRRAATVPAGVATGVAASIVDELVRSGTLVRDGDRLRSPDHHPPAPDPALAQAMERLERALDVAAPPSLAAAAAAAGCPASGVRDLERAGRIVVLAADLAYAMPTYRRLASTALELAGRGPLAPAAFRDATGTSRKYVMPILEDLDRRGILRRTPDGHLPGPRAQAGKPA